MSNMPAWFGRAMGGRIARPCRDDGGRVDKSPPNPGEVSGVTSTKYLSNTATKEAATEKSRRKSGHLYTAQGMVQNLTGHPIQGALANVLAGIEYKNADKATAKAKQYNAEAGAFARDNAKAVVRDVTDDEVKKDGGKVKKRSKR